jgi:hypothetical protein
MVVVATATFMLTGFLTAGSDLPEETDTGNLVTLPATAKDLSTGIITNWPESGYIFYFDDHTIVASNIEAWWSLIAYDPDRGYFYGYNTPTEVAHVTGLKEIWQITDATIYSYDSWYVGPVNEGDFVIFRNLTTGYYAAFKVMAINSDDTVSLYWYLQEDGSANFASLFTDGFESGDTTAWSSTFP